MTMTEILTIICEELFDCRPKQGLYYENGEYALEGYTAYLRKDDTIYSISHITTRALWLMEEAWNRKGIAVGLLFGDKDAIKSQWFAYATSGKTTKVSHATSHLLGESILESIAQLLKEEKTK